MCSLAALAVLLIVNIIRALTKKSTAKLKKPIVISAIMAPVSILVIVVSMIVGSANDPVAWCGHEYTVLEQQDASCTSSGYIKKKCTLCNNEVTEIIEPYHLWTEDGVTEATCTTRKQIKKVCTVCGTVEYEAVGELLAHSWIEDGVTEATCTTRKQIKKICTVCGDVEYETTGELLAHSWVRDRVIEATCLHPKQLINKCSVCGMTETIEEGSTIGHSFGAWVVSVEPTTDKEGQQTRKCTVCGHGENAAILKRSPISILSSTYDKDYFGGIEWTIELQNNSDKAIKYITLEWRCYNAVGDPVYDSITGKNLTGMKITGPLESGKTGRYSNASKFYNHSYASSTIVTIKVEFMDGQIVNIDSDEYTGIFK